jgi:type I restriction enzyme S subunit
MIKESTMEKSNYLSNWELISWKEVLEIRSGRNQKAVLNPNGKYPIIGSAGKVMGYADDYICEEGTTIIGRKGTINSPLFIEHKFWNVDTAFGLYSKESLDSRFLHYFCLSFDFTELDKGSGRPSLVKSDLLKVQIPLPPLPQQKQIVATLDKAFAAIDTAKANAEQNLQNAKELFESYLQNVFENKGDDWDEKSLGEVCEINPKKSEVNNLPTNHLVSFLPMKDLGVAQNKISSTKIKQLSEVKGSYTYFRNNDVLLAKVTPCFENGKLGIAKGLKNKIGFGSSEYIVFRPKELILSEYLFYILSSNKFRNKGKKLMFGTTGLKRLSKDYVQSFTAPLPSLEKQLQLVKKLDALSSEIKKLEAIYTQKIADLEEMKKSVLQKAFSGQLNTIN